MKEAATKKNQKIYLYSTVGTSMFPFICRDEHIVVKNVPPGNIEIGDIVLFSSEGNSKVAHRVAGKEFTDGSLKFWAKGDRHNSQGDPIDADRILGRIIALKRKNRVFNLPPKNGECISYVMSCILISLQCVFQKMTTKIFFLLKHSRM